MCKRGQFHLQTTILRESGQVGDHSGGKVSLRSNLYDIDLNRLPYNGYLNGPTFEHLSEEEKQIRWMIMKTRFPIFDKDY